MKAVFQSPQVLLVGMGLESSHRPWLGQPFKPFSSDSLTSQSFAAFLVWNHSLLRKVFSWDDGASGREVTRAVRLVCAGLL